MSELQFHPAARIFPLMDGEEFAGLVEDIREHGLREPVILTPDNLILDGRNRYRACMEAGVAPRFETYEGADHAAFVVSLNLKRRHLNESQRAMVAAKVATLDKGQRQDRSIDPSTTVHQAADLLNVSEPSVKRARKVHDRGAPELTRAVERGDISVSAAADISERPHEEQREIVARGEREILEAAKAIRMERQHRKRAERTAKIRELSNFDAPFPDRRFAVIYADPPWQYDFCPSSVRAVENHYPTMPIEDICALDVADLATPDAVLFLWAPPAFLKKALRVIEEWGFEYRSHMVWDKGKIGTGIYFRQRHELLFLAAKGKPITPAPGDQPESILRAGRGKHSQKPEEFHDLIERMYPDLPAIELFARRAREGWAAWGNEAEKAA